MLKIIDVEIDSRVVIPCPAIDFRPRRAANACPNCEYFKGVGLMSDEPDIGWHKKYAIRCTHVIERRTQLIPEVIEE